MVENRLLIVEDEVDLANVLKDFLENEGMSVELAHTGEQAFRLFKSFQPNLVILDIMLPDEDGKEICRQLRRDSEVPIMMLSAKGSDVDKILSLGLGADEYLMKPFSPAVLVAHVQAMLRRYRQQTRALQKDILHFDGLILDSKKHEVIVDGVSVALVSKEFDVLYYLASRPGEVISKETLYDAVWGEDAVGEISTVAVHLRRIREKVERDPSHPRYLKTIWGVGYKFEA